MMFTPRTYGSVEELRLSSILEAHSDTVEDGRDVFGYAEGQTFYCREIYCNISEAWYTIADTEELYEERNEI